jgi:hypothetical protein
VVWFGVRSFWGHLRHLIAVAIATEDVDSRDWMTPDSPEELLARVARRLGGNPECASLVEALERDVWIDYVADTGDDASVSAAVAQLIFGEYELMDPDQPGSYLKAPRGDILLFGGDTAYPVATVEEINNRVVVPFNRVLDQVGDGEQRVLLGIPGNHDWYDGLDGFARLFRRRWDDSSDGQRPSVVPIDPNQLERYAKWAKEFVRGGQRHKQKTLDLAGYFPVQGASYFALPLTRRLSLVGVDRQLRQLDFRQRKFFDDWLRARPKTSAWVLLPDPVRKFCEPSEHGERMISALGLDLDREPHFVLSGDVHHYQRWRQGLSTHVTAGGGGAFLHPAPLSRKHLTLPLREWPGPKQTGRLLTKVPWKVALGRSGFIPHWIYLALYAPVISYGSYTTPKGRLAAAIAGGVSAMIYAMVGGAQKRRQPVTVTLALLAGALTLAVPLLVSALGMRIHLPIPEWSQSCLVLVLSVAAGAWIFGSYLALLTWFGVERTQAFTALDHPGYKHFVRFRVRANGERIDAWCIGLENPLDSNERPVVVDAFSWAVDGSVRQIDGPESG